MYVTFCEYVKLAGPESLSEAEYGRIAPIADLVIDDWTLGRTARASAHGEELPSSVKTLYAAIVAALPSAIEESSGGERVASFSNGVDSFTFANDPLRGRLWSQLGWMAELLPVEWVSACVSFEGGSAYAG